MNRPLGIGAAGAVILLILALGLVLSPIQAASSGAPRPLTAARELRTERFVRSLEGDTLGALQVYDEALRLDPTAATAYGNRGVVRAHLGDRAGAAEDLQRAAQLFAERGD